MQSYIKAASIIRAQPSLKLLEVEKSSCGVTLNICNHTKSYKTMKSHVQTHTTTLKLVLVTLASWYTYACVCVCCITCITVVNITTPQSVRHQAGVTLWTHIGVITYQGSQYTLGQSLEQSHIGCRSGMTLWDPVPALAPTCIGAISACNNTTEMHNFTSELPIRNCHELHTCWRTLRVGHLPQLPLQSHPSGHFGEWVATVTRGNAG